MKIASIILITIGGYCIIHLMYFEVKEAILRFKERKLNRWRNNLSGGETCFGEFGEGKVLRVSPISGPMVSYTISYKGGKRKVQKFYSRKELFPTPEMK